MIGKIYYIIMPYFDVRTKQNSFKKRPALIISDKRNGDYTVLPISSVSKKQFLDAEYDIEIDITVHSKLGLKKHCYIRTHKQTIANETALLEEIGDMKRDAPDLFDDVMLHLDQFNEAVFDNAVT